MEPAVGRTIVSHDRALVAMMKSKDPDRLERWLHKAATVPPLPTCSTNRAERLQSKVVRPARAWCRRGVTLRSPLAVQSRDH